MSKISNTKPGRLFVVALPIGNLEDLSVRALRTLQECDGILAEDTRHTKKLCNHFGIVTPLRSYHAHTSESSTNAILDKIESGARLCLVSDAGTPAISDPGAALVAGAHHRGIKVEPIPGPSALSTALSASGLGGSGFLFLGFLPRSGSRRKELIERIFKAPECVALFESPLRIRQTLEEFAKRAPDRRACLCRELTKLHEEIQCGSIAELLQLLQSRQNVRGEITLVIEGRTPSASDDEKQLSEEALAAEIETFEKEGLSPSAIAKNLAKIDSRSRSDLYDFVVDYLKRSP